MIGRVNCFELNTFVITVSHDIDAVVVLPVYVRFVVFFVRLDSYMGVVNAPNHIWESS